MLLQRKSSIDDVIRSKKEMEQEIKDSIMKFVDTHGIENLTISIFPFTDTIFPIKDVIVEAKISL